MRSKKSKAALVLAGLMATAAAVIVIAHLRRTEPPEGSPAQQARFDLVDRGLPEGTIGAGDAEHGRRLYAVHCSSCHGTRGDGFGPAATYLWPPPRDHTDGSHMNSRSDAELYRVIVEGGKATNRSALMPAWKDRFDPFEIWNLVAYIRTLHPRLPTGFVDATFHEVILSGRRANAVGMTLGVKPVGLDHRVVFYRLYDSNDQIMRYATFPRVPIGGSPVQILVVVKPDGSLEWALTHRQIALYGLPRDFVDKSMGRESSESQDKEILETLRAAVHKAALQVAEAQKQEKEDLAEAEATYQEYRTRPDSMSLGRRLYVQSCGACHGVTGRIAGPLVTLRDFRPRNHADGSFMNLLSDDYIRSVTKYGGLYWNVSGAMPANPNFSEEELTATVNHVRSLAIPPGNGRCPCALMASGCMISDNAASCCCSEGHGVDKLCAKMKK